MTPRRRPARDHARRPTGPTGRVRPPRPRAGAVVLALFALPTLLGLVVLPPVLLPDAASAQDVAPAETNVQYGSGDAATVLDVYRPSTPPSGSTSYPAVVVVHGGGWSGGDKADVAPNAAAFAAAGFVAFNINYTLTGDDLWPREMQDVQTAVRWVQDNRARYQVDPARVGLMGSSAGGNLSMLVGTHGVGEGRPAPRAVASWSGPTDLATVSPFYPTASDTSGVPVACVDDPYCLGIIAPGYLTNYLGCTMDDCPEAYRDASPVFTVTASTTPMFLAGAEQDLVPFSQNREMAAALARAGRVSVLLLIPGAGHADSYRAQAIDPTIAFLRAYVAEGADPAAGPGSPPTTAVGSAALPTGPLPVPPDFVVNAPGRPWWKNRYVRPGALAFLALGLVIGLGLGLRHRRTAAA